MKPSGHQSFCSCGGSLQLIRTFSPQSLVQTPPGYLSRSPSALSSGSLDLVSTDTIFPPVLPQWHFSGQWVRCHPYMSVCPLPTSGALGLPRHGMSLGIVLPQSWKPAAKVRMLGASTPSSDVRAPRLVDSVLSSCGLPSLFCLLDTCLEYKAHPKPGVTTLKDP